MTDLPLRTSALKRKFLPLDDLDRLETRLRRLARSPMAVVTADWLRAGCLTGLRPCEWSDASLDGDLLTVRNRKTSNGRGNGVFRTLDLSALSNADLSVVARMAERGAGWAALGTYASRQAACAEIVREACLAIWPSPRRHYTLYSARHQALANAKDALSPVEVGALAGHKTSRTAVRSYGLRGSAWRSPDAPGAAAPTEGNVATVIEWTNPRFGAKAPTEDLQMR